MSTRIRPLMASGAVALVSFAANCAVFVFSYNRVATPFLAEEQRVANAGFIMTVTAGAFSIVALLTGVAVYLLIRHRRP